MPTALTRLSRLPVPSSQAIAKLPSPPLRNWRVWVHRVGLPAPVSSMLPIVIVRDTLDWRRGALLPLTHITAQLEPWLPVRQQAFSKRLRRLFNSSNGLTVVDRHLADAIRRAATGSDQSKGSVAITLVACHLVRRVLKSISTMCERAPLRELADAVGAINLLPTPAPSSDEYAASLQLEQQAAVAPPQGGAQQQQQQPAPAAPQGGTSGQQGSIMAPLTNMAATVHNAQAAQQPTPPGLASPHFGQQHGREAPQFFYPTQPRDWPKALEQIQLTHEQKGLQMGLFKQQDGIDKEAIPEGMPLAKEWPEYMQWSCKPIALHRPYGVPATSAITWKDHTSTISLFLGFCTYFHMVPPNATSLLLFTNVVLWVKFMSFMLGRSNSSQYMTSMASHSGRVLVWLKTQQCVG